MANNRNVYQQVYNASIPRVCLLDAACNEDFGKKTFRVLLTLLTELDGWKEPLNHRSKDPENYKRIDIKSIADTLNLSKKEVQKSIDELISSGFIEEGCSDTVKKGYRFRY